MSPAEYLASLESTYRIGKAREHSYRPAFAALLESRGKAEVTALNDPHGSPRRKTSPGVPPISTR